MIVLAPDKVERVHDKDECNDEVPNVPILLVWGHIAESELVKSVELRCRLDGPIVYQY